MDHIDLHVLLLLLWLQVGDQIIEINGYNTTNMTHSDAIELISSGGSTVKLLVKRTGKPLPPVGVYFKFVNIILQ